MRDYHLAPTEVSKLYDALDKIVSECAEDIDNNNYENVYYYIKAHGWHSTVISAFTDLLHENGIDPLKYMKTIPAYFSNQSYITDLVVPRNITALEDYCFGSNLERIFFEGDDLKPDYQRTAFKNCYNLKEIICGKNVWQMISYYYGIWSSIEWTPI